MNFAIVTVLSLMGARFGKSVTPDETIAPNNLEDISFSRNIGVYFHPPLVRPYTPFTLNYQEITPYLDLVHSRFSAITIQPYVKVSIERQFPEIYTPLIAAQINARNENRSLLSRTHNKLKVYLSYSVNVDYKDGASKLGDAKSNFDFTKQVADYANQMNNGTVEYLTYDLLQFGIYDTDAIAEQLTDARQKIAGGPWKYKLGMTLPIDRCVDLTSGVSKENWRLLSLVDFSVFAIYIFENDLKVPAHNFSRCVQRKMEKCKKILSDKQAKLEVIFTTMWPGGGERDRDLVWYWRTINDWAEKANSTVFMFEAFDSAGRNRQSTIYDATGWWQVDHGNGSVNGQIQGGYPVVTEKWLRFKSEMENFSYHTDVCLMKAPTLNDNTENSKCQNDTAIQQRSGNGNATDALFKHNNFIVYFAAQFQRPELKNVFDDDDFIPLLKLVRTRFSNIMVAPVAASSIEYGSSTFYIPTAVAKLNRGHHKKLTKSFYTDHNYLRLFLMYDHTSLEYNQVAKLKNLAKTAFDLTIKVADKANSIFENTVEYIALRFPNLLENIDAVHQLDYSAWRMSQNRHENDSNRFTYKLGMMMAVKYCGGSSSTVADYLEYLFKFVSFVMFESPAEFVNLGEGKEYNLEEYQTKLEFCLRKMRKSHPNIEVMFSCWWPDAAGENNGAKMAILWEAMNHWSKKTNTTVLMYEAFDNLATTAKISQEKSLGWWRYEEHCPCASTTKEYRFVEKRDLQGCSPIHQTIPSVLNSPVPGKNATNKVPFQEFFSEASNNPVPKFNRPHFGVYLDSFENLRDIDLVGEEAVATAVIRMVHTRFSKIVLNPIQEGNVLYQEMYTDIPKRAAEFNREQKSSITTSRKIDPVEIIMTFGLESLPLLLEKTEGTNDLTSFDVVLGLANEANAIFPETVKVLMLQYSELSEGNVNAIGEQLREFQRKISSRSVPYKLGVILLSVDCGFPQEEKHNYMWEMLPHVKMIFFTHWITQHDWDIGADERFEMVINEFSECKQKIQKEFPDLEVGLYTSWSDTDENGKQNLTQLVYYWGKMNQFSKSSNTNVILGKAFDGRDALTERVHYAGWWKRKDDNSTILNKSIQKTGVYEEKYQIVSFENEPWRELFPDEEEAKDCGGLACNRVNDLSWNFAVYVMVMVVICF